MIYTEQPQNMAGNGMIVNIYVTVPKWKSDALKAQNKPVPTYPSIRALIDTGATKSCINKGIATKLGLSPTDAVNVGTAGGMIRTYLFDVAFLANALGANAMPLQVFEINLQGQSIQALIGRDVLKMGLLVYNGTTNTFSFAV